MSSANRNVRLREFREMFERLPATVRRTAVAAYERFQVDPSHPALRHHDLGVIARGPYDGPSFSVSITKQYRAIYTVNGGVNVWHWIGSHNDYENYIGKK